MATIMIVDDSSFTRRTHRRIVESDGHVVHEATSGMAAIESFFLHRPDLVLLDLTMEDMSGFDVLEKLRDECQLKSATRTETCLLRYLMLAALWTMHTLFVVLQQLRRTFGHTSRSCKIAGVRHSPCSFGRHVRRRRLYLLRR